MTTPGWIKLQQPEYRDVFCAALTGYCASYAGCENEPDPHEAVAFATEVARICQYDKAPIQE